MSIRKQAAMLHHEVVGKLFRHAEYERANCERYYLDEAGNEYYIRRGILTIITAEGGVI